YPGHISIFEEAAQLWFAIIEADSNNLEALVMVFPVSFDHIGQFIDARPAPRSPEIDQNNFSFVIGNRQRLPIEVLCLEIWKLCARYQRLLDLLRRFLLVDI